MNKSEVMCLTKRQAKPAKLQLHVSSTEMLQWTSFLRELPGHDQVP